MNESLFFLLEAFFFFKKGEAINNVYMSQKKNRKIGLLVIACHQFCQKPMRYCTGDPRIMLLNCLYIFVFLSLMELVITIP